jgi:subtilase family serine protease
MVTFALACPGLGWGLQSLVGHVPAAIRVATPQAALPATQRLHLVLGLPLHHAGVLNQLLHSLYDPADPLYRHFLKPGEFVTRFSPSTSEYQALVDFAKSRGFLVTATHANRTLLDVEAPVSAIQSTFHVIVRNFRRADGSDFYAPESEPSLDSNLPLSQIGGLNNLHWARPLGTSIPLDHATPMAGTGSGLIGTFVSRDLRAAYAAGSTLSGTGQVLGLFEMDGYFAADIAKYCSDTTITAVPLQNVLVDGFNGSAGPYNSEVALDIEVAMALAPGLSRMMVYEGPSSGDSVVTTEDVLDRMASDDLAMQISSSWEAGPFLPADLTQLNQVYLQFAAQGQSFFQASGDSGAYISGDPMGILDQSQHAQLQNLTVTVVGGTQLTTNGPGGPWLGESSWRDISSGRSGGGGSSTDLPIPAYQQGISMATNMGSTTMRNIPDVSMAAFNIFTVLNNGAVSSSEGTSAAAPLWAAFTALVNQQASSQCGTTVGFLNPALYLLAKGPSYNLDFHDIKDGSTDGYFPAVTSMTWHPVSATTAQRPV